MTGWTTDQLDLPRRGWVARSPVAPLPELAHRLGVRSLHVKRDDLCGRLPGGTKLRKLDVLLAAPPWSDAPRWISVGGMGSGHLAALSACAKTLGRTLEAHLFWEPLSEAVLENLAFLASGPTVLRYHRNRWTLGLARPRLAVGHRPPPAIQPGASGALSTLGVVRGALELAEQVAAGELPPPDQVWVPLGSGGTAVGLSIGLALAGLDAVVFAVAAVERPLASTRRLRAQQQRTLAALEERCAVPEDLRPAPIRVLHGWVGPRYGQSTAASLAACSEARVHGFRLEPVYSGKAWAAMRSTVTGGHVVFWLTPHGQDLPRALDWRERVPARLRRRLDASDRWGPSRRALVAGAAAGVAGAAWLRRGHR